MTELLVLGDISVEVEYKPVKNLHMTVYPPDGRVHISAPRDTSREYIRNFVISKLRWIEKHRTLFRGRNRQGNHLLNEGICHVWGIAHKVKLIERRGPPKILLNGGALYMYIRPDTPQEKRLALLDKWYRGILRTSAPALIKKWEPLIGVEIRGLYVRKMKSHWGSCNYDRQTIRLNTELVKNPPEFLEYVIVHEMIHIIEPSHNQNFYRLMNKFLPSWRITRKKMNAGKLFQDGNFYPAVAASANVMGIVL
ncbi:MAG: M48 family metallopeptidase [Treponema sp.]|jgi:predicted metal-dependent hydrolase|nr:M48 family metallopeptidase [Treponema sp.]